MKNFWGYTTNGEFSVGCTGQTIYLYDKSNNEIKKFKDIIYAYTPVISPDGKLFVVKSTNGTFAAYSLETFQLIKKHRYTKYGDNNGFCFSHDGQLFINIESIKDCLHSAITIYNTSDFSIANQIFFDDKTVINFIEFDENTRSYYVLGFIRVDKFVANHYFISKFEDQKIEKIITISEKEYDFFHSYKSLSMSGFTEKKYRWTFRSSYSLDELKNMNLTLAKLYSKKQSCCI